MRWCRTAVSAGLLLLSSGAVAQAAVVTLAWDPSADATGYQLNYGTASGLYTNTIDVGNRTTYVIDLPGPVRYYFAVRAYNAGGESPFSTEINTMVDADVPAAPSIDLVFQAAPSSLDIAFDGPSRRYLVPYVLSGQVWGLLLDVWGNQAGTPFLIASGTNTTPRAAGGGGGFMVTYTQSGQRYARSIVGGGGTPLVSAAYSLGAAVDAPESTDNAGNDVAYVPGSNVFLAAWDDGSNVMMRAIGEAGALGSAVNVTSDIGDPNCTYGRAKLAWDPDYKRAMLIGARGGASCTGGDAVWSRLMSFDGAAVSTYAGVRIVSTTSGPQSFRDIAFSASQHRFLIVWSEARSATTVAAYVFADAAGSMSAPIGASVDGSLTPESADDASTENAVAVDPSGGFALISRNGTTPGQLNLYRIATDGSTTATFPQLLPATGDRMHTAAVDNSVTGQIVVAYIDSQGHLRTLTIGTRVLTTLSVSAPTSGSVGTPVVLSAQAAGGAAPYEYEFWRNDALQGWQKVQPYSLNATLTWTPTTAETGANTFEVRTRSVGSAADQEASRSVTVQVTSPPVPTVTVTADRTGTVTVGTTVTWTAQSSGVTGTPEYQFWIYDGLAWSLGRDWATSNTFAWTPTVPGVYTIQVRVRAVGSTVAYEARTDSASITVTAAPPRTVSVTADRTNTVTAGTTVTWTAQSSGGTGTPEYQFWIYDGLAWSLGRDWATSNTFAWTPTVQGVYTIQVRVRSVGSTVAYEARTDSASITVTAAAPRTLSVTADRTGAVSLGTTVTWTAQSSGGTGTPEYRFWVYNGTWSLARDWATSNTYSWTPTVQAAYTIQVWVRAVGSTVDYEVWANSPPITVTAPVQSVSVSIVASRTTATPGQTITWTATASGGSGSYQYQFWRYNVETAAWVMVQGYSAARIYDWTPGATDAGTYYVQVWVRQTGSTAQYETFVNSTIVTVKNVTVTALTADVTLPRPVGTSITWTATATIVLGTGIEYEYRLYSQATATWQTVRPYSTTKTWTWVPTAAGTYIVQVRARTVGNTRSYESWLGSPVLTISP